MARKRPQTKVGRPLKKINEDLVFELAKIHCTVKEIAAVCKCHEDTLHLRCRDLIDKGKEEGRCSLRRLQWKAANEGNVNMLIWLGKQLLNQREKHPDEATQVNFNVMVSEVPK
jgi:hypothetical protein